MIRGRPNITDNAYAYYLTQWEEVRNYAIGQMTGTSGRQRVPVDSLDHLNVPLPPLPEQRVIAHVLSTMDDKIEVNRQMNHSMEGMIRAIFQDWFVEFGPVRTKQKGQEPYLPSELWDLFPNRLVDSELGEVPAGWEVRQLGEFSTVIYGAAFASKRFNESGKGLPLLRIRDLATHNPAIFTDEQHPKGQLIQMGDIVVGMDGEFRAHLWKGPPSWLNQRVCHFRPNQGIPRLFLLESLIGPLADFERSKVGTTVIHLSKSDIDSIRLVRPTTEVFDAFRSLTDPVVQQIGKRAAESRLVAAKRDALLPRLVSGEIRVDSYFMLESGE